VLVFLGYKHHAGSKKPALSLQSQLYDDIDTSYRCFYSVILITCCVVGMICCRRFGHQRSKISFLEYLLLLATSGVLFQSVKRILAFTVKWEASDSATKQGAMQFLPVYFVTEFLDIFQTLLQIVFYYYVKDAKLHDGLLNNRSSVTVLKNIITVMAMSNFALWIRDSFFLTEMSTSVTPFSNYDIEKWPVFDNVTIPIYIFFRFNSALLFWCIREDVFHLGASHQGRVAPDSGLPRHAPHQRSVPRPPVSSRRPTWPSHRFRCRLGRPIHLRRRTRPSNETRMPLV